MSAGVNGTRYGIGVGVRGADYRVKLTEHKDLRSLPSRVDYGIKARNTLGIGQLVAKSFKFFCHICRRFVFLVSCLGIFPYMSFRLEYQIAVFVYGVVYNVFHNIVPFVFYVYLLQSKRSYFFASFS